MTVHISSGNFRFNALLRGEGSAAHDKPLLDQPTWIVAPTLGAIIPNWLLAIPRQPVLSFREWGVNGGERPEAVLRAICMHLGLSLDEIIWFEHGPSTLGTTVGCGLDHAHLHILVRPKFSFSAFASRACTLADLAWQEHHVDCGYSALEGEGSYCIAGSGDRSISASHVDAVGSQFFRRVVSAVAGVESVWDYRRFAHTKNIEITIETFRSLESAARRER
jgi:ATP adenylyltransferase